MNSRTFILSLLALGAAACGPEFDPYNELKGMRVLAVRAEPAELTEGTSTTVDALIHRGSGDAPTLRWSVCPWPSDPNGGFQCALAQADWQAAWEAAGLSGQASALDLGTGSTAALSFPGTLAQAKKLCHVLAENIAAAVMVPPDCERSWPWTVRLSTRASAAHIETVKDVTLLLTADAVPNQNPTLTALRAGDKALGAMAVELAAGKKHALRIEVPDSAAEIYRPTPALGEPPKPEEKESLLFTWFVDQGSTEKVHTSFKEGVEALAPAIKNEWEAPDEAASATLYVVVRDPRGGVGFISGTVQLTEGQ
jgi:hypothetical protein